MDERRRNDVLDAVAGSVGLMVDDGLVDDHSRRIVRRRIGEGPRLLREPLTLAGKPSRGPMSTGVSIRMRHDDQELRCVATASHVLEPETTGWMGRVRFIPGLRDFERAIGPDQEHEPKELIHYERAEGRDLVIVRLDGTASGLQSMSLPPESMDRIDDEEVYVVGHAGGRPLSVFAAKVGTRVPDCGPSGCRGLRGVNLKLVDGAQQCLSGAPVFAWREGTPQLLGIVQGNFVLRAILASIKKRLRPYAIAMGKSSLEDTAYAMERSMMRRLLDDARSEWNISEDVIENFELGALRSGRIDSHCSDKEVIADVYMVFLGGALSTSFY